MYMYIVCVGVCASVCLCVCVSVCLCVCVCMYGPLVGTDGDRKKKGATTATPIQVKHLRTLAMVGLFCLYSRSLLPL